MEKQFNLPKNEEIQALRDAVFDNKLEILRHVLLKYPGLVNSSQIFANEETLLHVASENGYLALVNILIDEFGARADIVAAAGGGDLCDVLPIHYAAYNNHADVVRKLAEIYPEGLNEHDGLGFTPLQEAITNDAEDAIDALLECGELDFEKTTSSCDVGRIDISVNPDITTDDIESGTTSEELAQMLQKPIIVELLRREVICLDGEFKIQKLGRRFWLTQELSVKPSGMDSITQNMGQLSVGDNRRIHDASRTRFLKKIKIPLGADRSEIILKLITIMLYESRGNEWQFYQKALELLNPEFKNFERQHYIEYLKAQESTKNTYWGENCSENSDDEDNAKLGMTEIPEIISTISKLQKTKNFWIDTRRTTAKKVGLQENLAEVVSTIKEKFQKNEIVSQAWVVQQLKSCEGKLIKKPAERASLPYESLGPITWEQYVAKEKINAIITGARERERFTESEVREVTELCERYQIYIPQFRGLNYMIDRWDAGSRRYHRNMNEVEQPQHSEMVLKTLPFNFYTELGPDHDYSVIEELKNGLVAQDALVRDFLFSLRESGEACVDFTDRSNNTPYVFNNILERLQHSYSNGIRDFLAELEKLREEYPSFWGRLPNAFNPFVSTGHGVYHCLKYAYGMKTYYGNSLLPRYHRDGKIEYSHVGKVYAMLYRFDELFFFERPNNVPQLDKEARVRLLNEIGPEKEIAFLGFVKDANVVYQCVAKFPDFRGPYQPIYEIKYGINEKLYDYFRYLIIITEPGTPPHEAVISLLNEWICAYQEILLNRMMLQKVKEKGGVLFFWGEDGLLTLEPTMLLMRGGSPNQETRQRTHFLRQHREVVGRNLQSDIQVQKGKHGFKVVSQKRFRESFDEVPQETMYERLKAMPGSQAYKLTPEQHGKFSRDQRRFSLPGFKGSVFFSTPQAQPTQSPQLFSRAAFSEGGVDRKPLKSRRELIFQQQPKPQADSFEEQYRLAQKLSLIQFQAEGREPRNLYGLVPHNPDYDEGDCLFAGVAVQDAENRAGNQLRQVLVERIGRHDPYRIIIERTLKTSDMNDRMLRVGKTDQLYDSIQQYLERMARNGTWGRDIEVKILSDILQRPIVILTPNNDNDSIFEEPTYAHCSPIFLNLVNRNHFQPLQVPQALEWRVIIDQIRQNIQQNQEPSVVLNF